MSSKETERSENQEIPKTNELANQTMAGLLRALRQGPDRFLEDFITGIGYITQPLGKKIIVTAGNMGYCTLGMFYDSAEVARYLHFMKNAGILKNGGFHEGNKRYLLTEFGQELFDIMFSPKLRDGQTSSATSLSY